MHNVIGIDVSKATLDAYCLTRNKRRQGVKATYGLASLFDRVSMTGRSSCSKVRRIRRRSEGFLPNRMTPDCLFEAHVVNPRQAR
ncbi:hypothetical protein GGQ68_003587 [Sagittula marina]|uniref:Transposase n=1 Tax=Sagittula marina TaxID=943940 RepID=A0A7W6GT95_9RHOB|nr:hypothetical protein [Sagittula marina]